MIDDGLTQAERERQAGILLARGCLPDEILRITGIDVRPQVAEALAKPEPEAPTEPDPGPVDEEAAPEAEDAPEPATDAPGEPEEPEGEEAPAGPIRAAVDLARRYPWAGVAAGILFFGAVATAAGHPPAAKAAPNPFAVRNVRCVIGNTTALEPTQAACKSLQAQVWPKPATTTAGTTGTTAKTSAKTPGAPTAGSILQTLKQAGKAIASLKVPVPKPKPASTTKTTATTPQPAKTAAPAAPDWSAIAQAAAPYVFEGHSYHCTILGCKEVEVGTAYAAYLPWPAKSGHSGTALSVVTASHMVCRETRATRIDRFTAGGQSIADGNTSAADVSGLCLYQNLGGDESQDVVSWPAGPGTTSGLQVATHPATVGEPVMVLGHPLGESAAAPVEVTGSVIGTGVTLHEAVSAGDPQRTLTGAIEIQADGFPGDSGAPVLDANGHVIGTFVADGPSLPAGAAGHQVTQQLGYVVPWGANMAPVGFTSQDGLVNHLLECPSGWLARLRCKL